MAKKRMTNKEKRQIISDELLKGLTETSAPWRKPWVGHPNAGIPTKLSDEKPYSGINPLVLMVKPFRSKWWGTMNQWNGKKCKVKKGQKASWITFYQPVTFKNKEDEDGNEVVEKTFPILKSYKVFNAEQVEGDFVEGLLVTKEEYTPNFQIAQDVVDKIEHKVLFGGNKAIYLPKIDTIQIPNFNQFEKEEEFWATYFHELAHWSESRLEWTGTYAQNEMVAEISSAFIMATLNLPMSSCLENHKAYVRSWQKKMKENSNYIFEATKQAHKVVDFLLKGEENDSC